MAIEMEHIYLYIILNYYQESTDIEMQENYNVIPHENFYFSLYNIYIYRNGFIHLLIVQKYIDNHIWMNINMNFNIMEIYRDIIKYIYPSKCCKTIKQIISYIIVFKPQKFPPRLSL